MKNNIYLHPALSDCSTYRAINCIVTSKIQTSKFVQIISVASNEEKSTIFIPRKIFTADIASGRCFCIEGEDRHKDYYGDIFIAENVIEKAPDISLFFLYAAHNFPLLNKFVLQTIIEENQQAFIQAIARDDLNYFVEKGLTPYLARRLLTFSQSKLFLENT